MPRWKFALRLRVLLMGLLLNLPATDAASQQKTETLSLSGLRQPVQILIDRHGVPHIYASTASDALVALGYLHARDRLFEMEFLRRRARGELAELLGPDYFEADLLMRLLGIRRSSEAAWRSDRFPARVRTAIEAYCRGVNARLTEVPQHVLAQRFGNPDFRMRPWSPIDVLSFVKYMGWDQSGTDDDLWFGEVVARMGRGRFEELWPIDRPFEIPVVPEHAVKMKTLDLQGAFLPPPLSPDVEQAFADIRRLFAAQPRVFRSEHGFGSNNWVVDGVKSVTGKPLLANDPHLGFQLPSLWYVAHLSAPDWHVTGVTFPGVPFVVIGHNDRIAWGMTNMQADAVDFFIETVHPQDSTRYRFRGEWRDMRIVTERIRVAGEGERVVRIRYTHHGPVINRRGRAVAMQWTGLGPTFEGVALAEFNRARNVRDFKRALTYLDVPALNMIYADIDGNIAIAPHGKLPIRKHGWGRVPHPGDSGDFDWLGFIPRDELPFALNPPQHYLLSANQRPAPAGYPFYLGWMWDPGYRSRRIHQVLAGKQRVTLQDMQALQYDVFSMPASVFVPILLKAFEQQPPGDSLAAACLQVLREWNFEMRPELSAPVIWTVWFDTFREQVWEDDFEALQVPRPPGSWGFTGNNRREPVLEVLEWMTRYVPDSPWFDDRRTPEVETRDDILRRSFLAAMQQLRAMADRLGGAEPRDWRWGRTHRLHVAAITGRPEHGRSGTVIPGGRFTVNPGGGLDGTGGGASWRMIVDFADFNRSVGVYPGGQSGMPGHPHYDDWLPLWAQGKYIPLYFHPLPDAFPKQAIESVLNLKPKNP